MPIVPHLSDECRAAMTMEQSSQQLARHRRRHGEHSLDLVRPAKASQKWANAGGSTMQDRQSFADDDEKTKCCIAAMIEAERVILARRRAELEDCACKSGMFPDPGRRRALFAPARRWQRAWARHWRRHAPGSAKRRRAPSCATSRTIRQECREPRSPMTAVTAPLAIRNRGAPALPDPDHHLVVDDDAARQERGGHHALGAAF